MLTTRRLARKSPDLLGKLCATMHSISCLPLPLRVYAPTTTVHLGPDRLTFDSLSCGGLQFWLSAARHPASPVPDSGCQRAGNPLAYGLAACRGGQQPPH